MSSSAKSKLSYILATGFCVSQSTSNFETLFCKQNLTMFHVCKLIIWFLLHLFFRTKRSDSSESTDVNQSDTYTTPGAAAQPESHTYSSLQPPHVSLSKPSEERSNTAATYETLQHAEDYYNMGTYAKCTSQVSDISHTAHGYENTNIYVNDN